MLQRASYCTRELQTQLEVVTAQNARLSEENSLLRHRLESLSNDEHHSAALNVESRLKAFQLEDEFERLTEHMENLKKKYNKLHDAFLEKVKRCKALEETFKRQKTLTGLVMKSAIAQRVKEQKVEKEKRSSEHAEHSEVEQLQLQVNKLQAALDEAYDIIEELEFELESVDLLEMQNQNLRKELSALKAQHNSTLIAKIEESVAEPVLKDKTPPDYDSVECNHSSAMHDSWLNLDDADEKNLERAALTRSLIQTAEAESNCLRRELLRSRLKYTLHAKDPPTE